jgi:uncharacterized membrane protein YhaH (DUF805 family)
MNFGHILFSFSGRINRAKWWLAVLIMFVINIVMYIVAQILGDTVGSLVNLVVAILLLWISLAAGSKRLHDLDRSGAWLVLFVGGPILLMAAFIIYAGVTIGLEGLADVEALDMSVLTRVGGAAAIFFFLYLALVIWALVWFGCLRGTLGPNRFGPDPLEATYPPVQR